MTGDLVLALVQVLACVLFLLNLAALFRLVKGGRVLRRRSLSGAQDYTAALLKSRLSPDVSSIAVPLDSSEESRNFVRRLLDLHFGRNEVVIVLDGPTDEDMDVWVDDFHLIPSARDFQQVLRTAPVRAIYESRDPIRLVLVDKDRGGSLDAWNAGVNVACSAVIAYMETGSLFDRAVLLRLIQPMLEAPDEIVAVCGGGPAEPNGSLPGRWAALHSLRSWLEECAAGERGNRVLPSHSSAVLASRDAVLSCGGASSGLELIVKLHSQRGPAGNGRRVAFLPELVSRGPGARSLRDLRLQARAGRRRLAAAFRGRLWRRNYVEESVRPRIETVTLLLTGAGLLFGWVPLPLAGLVLLASAGMGTINSMAAVLLHAFAQPAQVDPAWFKAMFRAAIPENFGYRQLRNLWSF